MTLVEYDVIYPGHVVRSDAIFTVAEDAWRASIALRGELDIADAPKLLAVLEAHLEAGRRVLRLDTTDVTFLDSTVLGAIVAAHRRCVEVHGSLILTGVSGVVDRIVKLTGLDRVLLIDTAAGDAAQ